MMPAWQLWNDRHTFKGVDSNRSSELVLRVYNENNITEDDEIGAAR